MDLLQHRIGQTFLANNPLRDRGFSGEQVLANRAELHDAKKGVMAVLCQC